MSTESVTRAGRVAAEARMLDAGVFARVTGKALNEATGKDEPTAIPVYSGKCEVQTFEPFEQGLDAAGHVFIKQRYTVKVPVGVGPIRIGDVCTLTAARLDPELVGRKYRVAGLLHKSYATSQRLLVDEIVA